MGDKARCCKPAIMGFTDMIAAIWTPGCSVLDLLQTDPKYQQRGVVGLLVQRGLDVTEQLCIPACLESPAKLGLSYDFTARPGEFRLLPRLCV